MSAQQWIIIRVKKYRLKAATQITAYHWPKPDRICQYASYVYDYLRHVTYETLKANKQTLSKSLKSLE